MIPELYRRPAAAAGALPPPRRLEDAQEIDAFGAEMIDRSVRCRPKSSTCSKIVTIKALCRRANVEKLDAGPKGVVIPSATRRSPIRGLVRLSPSRARSPRSGPDHKVVFIRDWEDVGEAPQGHRRADDPARPPRRRGREGGGVVDLDFSRPSPRRKPRSNAPTDEQRRRQNSDRWSNGFRLSPE